MPADSHITGWSIDSRTLAPGDLYFALRGEVHDGHRFLADAFERGAVAAIAEQTGDRILTVPDSLAALQRLASCARELWGGTVIGVTGSAGKTSTKDAIAHLLEVEMPVGRTLGNFNNHIGLPLSILRIAEDAKAAVLEMGMNHSGEIRSLAAIAKPQIGVVTNVGYAHVEFFDSIEGVAAAKRELIEALPAQGTAVLNADDPRVTAFAEVHRGSTVTYGFSQNAHVRAEMLDMTHFRCLGTTFETQLSGRHAVSNILAGIAVAQIFGIAPSRLAGAVQSLAPGKMRGERTTHNQITILNDCYNSNPAAAHAMIDVLRAEPARRRIAVLGEMLELGSRTGPLHRDLGRYVAESGMDVLIALRGAARYMADEAGKAGMPGGAAFFFEDPAQAGSFLKTLAQPGDAILFKGSRGVHVERALNSFLAEDGGR
ncbi:MAG: UDP-N-acetylmuramoyl-tripeptide--D-alanyl-D-alanine ligase [Acidobacteriota bacterium]|nr:UDP-N-acetylmuramoyl-tripeptide--D-alanyl-D-alanine ligase [Acidobacteriota bacterium]